MTQPKSPFLKFTPAELALCRRLAVEGETTQAMAKLFGRTVEWTRACRIAAEVPEAPFRNPRLFNEVINGVVVKSLHPISYDDLRRLPPCPNGASFEQRAQANAAFLISCLRAGHKYGAGEIVKVDA